MSISEPTIKKYNFDKVLEISVIAYQALAVIVFILIPIFAIKWWSTPFMGAFVEQTMSFNGVGPLRTEDEPWELFLAPVELYEYLLEVDGQPVSKASEISDKLSEHDFGDKVTITYLNNADEKTELAVQLFQFPGIDRVKYFFFPYIVGLIYLIIGILMLKMRIQESTGRSFSIFSASLAIGAAGLFDVYTTHHFTILWSFAIATAGAALLDLAISFPQEFPIAKKYPHIHRIPYVIAFILFLFALPDIYNLQEPANYVAKWQYIYGFTGLSILAFIGILVYRSYTEQSAVAKQQIQIARWGIAISFLPIGIWMFVSFISPLNFTPYILGFTVLFPVVVGYAILRFRLFRMDYLITRAILIVILSVVATLGFATITWGAGLIMGEMVPANNPYLLAGLVALLALITVYPIHSRLQSFIQSIAFRGNEEYEEKLQEFGQMMTNARSLSEISAILSQAINSTMIPATLHIYILDPASNQYIAMENEEGAITSDIRFTDNNPLTEYIAEQDYPFYINIENLPEELEREDARLKFLDASVFTPLKSLNKLMGWIAIGIRRSGDVYSGKELGYLENLSNQAGIAIERAQIVVSMEQQVEEMNALTLISQGVSITLTFNDVLELIFAQTTQIIPATNFHITLHNQTSNYFYYAFCIEDRQRLEEKENLPLPFNQGLAQWVARNSRALLTQDYSQEAQRLNLVPALQKTYAWIGVPLNAGSDTIGALSISSRDPNTTYTNKQLSIFRAIADQTAGAIVKARLLEETERRAKQLSTLNQITQQLTSTLEHEPLMQNILDSAVQILDCEAGSLFMVDQDTQELVFTVTVGPSSEGLVGTRLAPGTGIVGKTVESRAPVIENNARKSEGWWEDGDEQTGFSTEALMAIPLQVKERVLGVIEMVNKKNGLPFSEEDKELLTAFAGQASVAVENARLYTLTDQELNSRVEELSIMQRIDRELNATLETGRAMRTTLEWAMRRSSADAGIIGMIEEDGLQITSQEGYGDQLSIYEEKALPLELPALKKTIESAQAETFKLDPIKEGGLLPGTRTQTVVPIRRESHVIGLILLESLANTKTDVDFLGRLSDHAAIAIANAQLYAEVEAANIAKSDFVSFVAHELKNPMTSIKGYTELMAAGAVGEINDNQRNFLQTIRSNVMRMNTLVTDLNDNAKIEVGRLRIEFRGIDVQDVVSTAVNSLDKQIGEKNQTINVEIPEEMPHIWADQTRIEQVLVNFISNSYKYTDNDGIIIVGAEATENQWDPEGSPNVVHFWIKDNGIGMTEEDQKKIFTKFFRSDDRKAQEAPGTGLGLNITKSLIELQGGRTWFESKFREGTTFHFTVPIAEE